MKALFLAAALLIACASAQDQVPSFLIGTWEVSSTNGTCNSTNTTNTTCLQSISFDLSDSTLDMTYTNTSSCGGGSASIVLDTDVEVVDTTLSPNTTIPVDSNLTISTNAAGVTSLIVIENGCQIVLTKAASIMKVATMIVSVIAAFMLI